MPNSSQTARIVIVGLGSLAIAMGIGRFAFTPLLPLMREDGLVGISDGGVLASVHFLGYWLGAVFAAKIPYPPKTVLRLSLIAIGVSTFAMGMTDSLLLWSVLRWICGVCSAFALVLVSNYYIKKLADLGLSQKQGWVFSGVGIGIAVAGSGTLAIMAGGIGSAHSWLIFGGATLVAAVVVCAGIGPEIAASRADAQSQGSRTSPLSWRLVIAYGTAGIGYIIPATYLPVMARETVSSPLLFGLAWPVFGIAAFLSTLLAARINSRYSNAQIWTASQFIMAAGLVLPVIWPHISTVIIAGICVGGTFMIITMMGMKEAHRIAPVHDVMRHISVMTAAFASGQMIGPLFAGVLYDVTRSFNASLVITSLALAITALSLMCGSAVTKTAAT
ncbi:YbfB/YjiJ family MFS transporter [Hoeflea sp. TYP-13]|uniref:YbfB/YjiJ family MFS transporter n=1 Tax=Hoeflea sp. TYP-13 TaxID=3230023 RepID=UPI0034C5E8CE